MTRARAQASGLRARLEELGAAVTEAPAIRIEPLAFEAPEIGSFDILVLTSANGVERILPADVRALAGVTVAAIGRATADVLAARGLVPDVVPERAVGEALLEELGDVRGRRILVAAAEGARDVLPDGLVAGGADVTVLHTYRTVPEPVDPEAVLGSGPRHVHVVVHRFEPGRGDGGARALEPARRLDRARDEREPARGRDRAGGRGRPA